jgi:hypothetical protein
VQIVYSLQIELNKNPHLHMVPLNHMSTKNTSQKNNRNICFTCTSSLTKAAQITFETYSLAVQVHSLNQIRTCKISDPWHLLHRVYEQEVEIGPLCYISKYMWPLNFATAGHTASPLTISHPWCTMTLIPCEVIQCSLVWCSTDFCWLSVNVD